MPKHLYLFLLFAAGLASTQPASAQRTPIFQPIGAGTEGDLTVSLTEPLHVVLPEAQSEAAFKDDPRVPANRDEYLAQVAAQRTALETAAKIWHLSPIKFITQAELDQLEQDKQAKHLVLNFGFNVFKTTRAPVVLPALQLCLVGKVGSYSGLFVKKDYAWELLAYQLFNTNTKILLTGRWPAWQTMFHTSDAVSTVQQLQAYLEQRLKGQKPTDIDRAAEARLGQNAALLPAKTLLMLREQLGAKLPESKLRRAFPYPVQFADQAAIDAAAASADARYLYLRYITTNGGNGFQLLDAASGQLVGYTTNNSMRSGHPNTLEAPDLEEIVETATKK
ncbi:MAG: hypothetical protein ACRYF0_20175 [Janthinobacterium lividum]